MLTPCPYGCHQTCRVLSQLRAHSSRFPIKTFLPGLVDLLTDADSHCREAARTTLVALFANASPGAKSDLKKELEAKAVRKVLADSILRDVMTGEDQSHTLAKPATSGTSSVTASATSAARSSHSSTPTSIDRPSASATASDENIAPVYITSRHDLERTFAAMLPYFDGKETEHNWSKRESSMIKVRGMLRAEVHSHYPDPFLAGIQQLTEGILKAVASLRTTLSIHGTSVVTELADQLGSDLPDSSVDAFVPALLRMAGFTKRIVATASQQAVSAVLKNVSYRHRFLSWIWAGMQDKTVPTRISMTEHLITLLHTHAQYRSVSLESHDGVSIMVQFIKKGLTDPNKDVRAKARAAFNLFQQHWPGVAENLLEGLDSTARKQLLANPPQSIDSMLSVRSSGAPSAPASPAPSRLFDKEAQHPGSSTPSSSATTPSRRAGPSSAIVAAKRAAAARMVERRKREAEEAARLEQEQQATGEDTFDQSVSGAGHSPRHASPSQPDTSSGFAKGTPTPDREDDQTVVEPMPSAQRVNRSHVSASPQTRTATLTRSFGTSDFWRQDADDAGGDDTVQLDGAVRSGEPDASATMDLMAPMHGMSLQRGSAMYDESRQDDENSFADETTPVPRQAPFSGGPASSATTTPKAEGTPQAGLRDRTPSTSSSKASSTSLRDSSSATRLPRPVSKSPSSPSTVNGPLSIINSLQNTTSREARTPAARLVEGKGWFHDRMSRLEDGILDSPLKSKPDAVSWVEAIRSRQADVRTFKQLAKLSAAFKVSAIQSKSNGYKNREPPSDDAPLLRRGPAASKSLREGKQGLQGEVDDDTDYASEDERTFGSQQGGVGSLADISQSQIEAWRQGQLFERLFEALEVFFASREFPSGDQGAAASRSGDCTGEATAALILLHKIVENQFPLLPAMGMEGRLLHLVVSTIGSRFIVRGARQRLELGCTSILQAWSSRTEPASGLASLRAELAANFPDSQDPLELVNESGCSRRGLMFGALCSLFTRLPTAVVIEDELPRVKEWILQAINNQIHVQQRQAAIAVLVSACHELASDQSAADLGNAHAEQLLTTALGVGALRREQMDLVLYYLAKERTRDTSASSRQ